MSTNIFEKFNKQYGGDKIAKEVEEINANGGTGEFEKTPFGIYEVAVDKMDLVQTKETFKPMLAVQFKVVNGSQKGKLIFMNRVVDRAYTIHLANEFMKTLDSGVDVVFDGDYAHYHDTILDVFEAVKKQKLEYQLNYSQNSKGYDTWEIEEVFEN